MKQKYIKRQLSDKSSIEWLVGKGYQIEYAEMLSARGISADNFDNYFSDTLVFHSPFEMANMKEAVETISYVLETGGSVLIYGDYDADGLTASSILSLFFTDNGVENTVLIPTRDEGYGLHADKVIRAFERNFYDLVITVDCGISNADEVNRITEELGVEVIVTDHHELPEVLPDCVCVNPKLGYPFPYLAGAGVAWKLVEALSDREVASRYSLLAAIGTIGDIMPMQDENRSIVKLGIENFNHKNLQKLAEISKCNHSINANDIAMKIAPKINAAGRVGYPEKALSFLLCRDKIDNKLCDQLLELNDIRKKMLDDIVSESDTMCNVETIYDERMTFIYSDKWSHGLLGIVAARYKEKYQLPAVVMTLDGDNYVGSARGIDTLDLFEIFNSCKDYLVKFGGHRASVGFSVAKERLQEFRSALAKSLRSIDAGSFEKVLYYDLDVTSETKLSDILSLSDNLEPLLPQDKVVCRIRDVVKFANTFGKNDEHLSVMLASGLELKGFFKYGKYAPFIRNGANVDLLCTLAIDSYSKKICGIIEDITLENSVNFDEFYRLNLLKNFTPSSVKYIDDCEVRKVLKQDSVLAAFDDYDTYLSCAEKYDFAQYFVDIFFDNSISNKTVVVSPFADYNYAKYNQIVYFCDKDIFRPMSNKTHYVLTDRANADLYLLDLNREICLDAFRALKNKSKFDSVKSVYDKYLLGKMTYAQYLVSLRVFEELKLITIVDNYTVMFNKTDKQDLTNSTIYNCFVK